MFGQPTIHAVPSVTEAVVFNRRRVVELVVEFYRRWQLDHGTTFLVMPDLEQALLFASAKGQDTRWKDVLVSYNDQFVDRIKGGHGGDSVHRLVYDHVTNRPRRRTERVWFGRGTIIAANFLGYFSPTIDEATKNGLGWLIPANKTAVIVPMPTVRFAEGQPEVFHDDTGKPAVEWPGGTGYYFLHGTEFEKRLYFKIIEHKMLLQEIDALTNVDQRSIALQYLTFEQLVQDSDSDLLDVGAKGTRLYRLPLPFSILHDRRQGYGRYDYFIHMRDASHPEREFIEWVDPAIGRQGNAELCQAHAFGISLGDWLAIEMEG